MNYKGTQLSTYLRHAMPDPVEHIGPNTFLKYHATQYYIVLALSLNGEESQKNKPVGGHG